MDEIIKAFHVVKEEATNDDTAAALLVLAFSIQKAAPFNPANAENFGHELAIALKDVLTERPVRVEKA